jgi:hypothetical protein
MLVFLAVLSLASAANLHDNRLQILPSNVQRLDGQLVQLLRNPIQPLDGLRNVRYIEQNQYGLEPQRQQYSILSVQPDIRQSIRTILPNDQQLIFTSSQPNINDQYSIQTNGQQIPIVSIQPNNERVLLRSVQPIGSQKQIIIQSPDQHDKQILTLLESGHQTNPIQNLRIHSSIQPLKYSNILQPLQQTNPISVSVNSRPEDQLISSGVGNVREVGNGGQISSYFLRGSDLENQGVVNQQQVSELRQPLQQLQYSSLPVSVVQPSRHVNVHQVVQPQVRYTYLNSDPRTASYSNGDYIK